jgi:hypothetical protein
MKNPDSPIQDTFITPEIPLEHSNNAQHIPSVVPIRTRVNKRFQQVQTAARTSGGQYGYMPLILAMIGVTALGIIAGTLLYKASPSGSATKAALTVDRDGSNTNVLKTNIINGAPVNTSRVQNSTERAVTADVKTADQISRQKRRSTGTEESTGDHQTTESTSHSKGEDTSADDKDNDSSNATEVSSDETEEKSVEQKNKEKEQRRMKKAAARIRQYSDQDNKDEKSDDDD